MKINPVSFTLLFFEDFCLFSFIFFLILLFYNEIKNVLLQNMFVYKKEKKKKKSEYYRCLVVTCEASRCEIWGTLKQKGYT